MALKAMLGNAKKIVFFGGAGVSTSSGIPDFRGTGGLYTEAHHYDAPPEEILDGSYLKKHPQKFYEYYKNEMLYPDAKPNAAHFALAKLEEMGKLTAVITQNIDGLHQMAGSKEVYELHGTVHENYCNRCGRMYSLDFMLNSDGIPRCTVCGGIVRPNVVLYGEGLDAEPYMAAEDAIAEADVLIVGGTSLTVEPAASLVSEFRGEHLIIINYTPTPYDGLAEYVIRDSLSDVFNAILEND